MDKKPLALTFAPTLLHNYYQIIRNVARHEKTTTVWYYTSLFIILISLDTKTRREGEVYHLWSLPDHIEYEIFI